MPDLRDWNEYSKLACWTPRNQKYVNRRTSRRNSGERQEVKRKIRQLGGKFINLSDIKKQSKTAITKKRTERKEKEKRREDKKKKQVLPELETFYATGRGYRYH